MVVVDEAHHLFREAAVREMIGLHLREDRQLMLLSDISQSRGEDIEYDGAARRPRPVPVP